MEKIALQGYDLIEKLYDSEKTRVYRAQRKPDQYPVVIKFLKNDYPSFNALSQFRNQYTVASNLAIAGIVHALALEPYRNGCALVMEDTGSIDLQAYLRTHTFTLQQFFSFARRMTDILQSLYQNRVLHKGIKPANILIHPETLHIHLIDFSIASLLPREVQELQAVPVRPGALDYISPEQTGRMNRDIDYRTDFYAFGVSCYQILTGKLPFHSEDPMEVVHGHLAKQPIPLNVLNSKIPPALNNVILKLMAKTLEDRYQSAVGIQHDLTYCQQEWTANQAIPLFALGQQDIADRFQVSNKLFGRKQEVVTLLEAFDRVSAGAAEMILVAGFSGIGKTALINEVHKPIVRQRGNFVKGKFDQFKRDIPFSAMVQALQMLMRQLRSDTHLADWTTRLRSVLDGNGQVLIDVIPALAHIIGQQPAVKRLAGHAEQSRFHRLFQKFIQVLATREHPLVIFLDDLQWVDSATLQLTPLLMNPNNCQYLLLIGAYRDNEVTPSHPLMLTLQQTAFVLKNIHNLDTTINQITLAPLTLPDLTQLAAASLCCSTQQALPLTQLVLQKTQGNPFYAHQFLKSLYEDGFITFDRTQGCWAGDIDKIKPFVGSDEDVLDLMTHQLRKLPKPSQAVLKLAACIGSPFDLATLATVHEHSPADTSTDLWQALQEGFVLPLNDGVPRETIGYRFLHDRVQQAAYGLIAADQKAAVHLKIGRLLKQRGYQLDETLFDLVNQLNLGSALVIDQSERDELLLLNFKAGQKAKASTAYVAAARYFRTAIALLTADSWHNQYRRNLALFETAAETALLNRDFKAREHYADEVLKQATSLLDTITIHALRCRRFIEKQKRTDAVNAALIVLKSLGVSFPGQPVDAHVQRALAQIQPLLAKRSTAALQTLPAMTEPSSLAAARLMVSIAWPVFDSQPALFSLLAINQVRLSIKQGNAPESIPGYALYGFLLCTMGDLKQANHFADLALSLLEQQRENPFTAFIYATIYPFIKIWTIHPKDTLTPFAQGYRSAMASGDDEFAALNLFWSNTHAYFSGLELSQLAQKTADANHTIGNLHQDYILSLNQSLHQVITNLLACADVPEARIEATQRAKEPEEAKDFFFLAVVLIHNLMQDFLFHNPTQAVATATTVESMLDGLTHSLFIAHFYFYAALSHLAIYADAPAAEQPFILEKIATNQDNLQRWAKQAPMNFQHKWDLVEAERLRVTGDAFAAMGYYERAIQGAKTHAYRQEEALAHELSARFYFAWNQPKFAHACLTNAYYAYAHWGAKAKVRALEQDYPELLLGQALVTQSCNDPTTQTLDLNTIVKAAGALSAELTLTPLLKKMLDIVMENAGAGRCLLILKDEGQWRIKGESVLMPHRRQNLTAIPLNAYTDLPATLIQYVIDKQQALVLDDASDLHHRFYADPYFAHNPEIKSVLCQPIVWQTKPIGLLYLENALAVGVFHTERLEMLQMLASQAAICIENANLYATLEEKVIRRTQALEQEIVERKRAEQTADEAKQAAQAANHAKGTFLANMSHELRSPLNAVLGFAQIMQHSPDLPANHRDNVNIINRSGKYLLSLINDVLDLSKIEAGKITLDNSDIDLEQLLDEMHDLFHLRAEQKGLQFDVNRQHIPHYIHADGKKLRQIFINLLGNALKFTQAGGFSLQIEGIAQAEKAHLYVKVKDTGAGIAAEELPKLFDAFAQTASGRNAQEGTGLGLPISRKFVQLMGGDIHVRSTVGESTTFSFDFPVSTAHGPTLTEAPLHHHISALAPNQPRYRILIVDDKPVNRQLLIKLLNPFDFDLRDVSNGEEAVKLCTTWRPHLIWMDIRMPVMNGLQATQAIKANTPDDIKIVALTASALEDEQQAAFDAGCDDFLAKPFNNNDIFALMHKHIGIRYLYDSALPQADENAAEQALMRLNTLPVAVLSQMRTALENFNIQHMTTLIDEVRKTEKALADALQDQVKRYQYTALIELIDTIQNNDPPRLPDQ